MDTLRLTPHPKSTPYQVFLHLMMMAMYYVSVVSVVTLIVQYIDLIFPDQLLSYSNAYDAIRGTSSALIVTFPVFLLCAWFIRKAFFREPNERNIAVRRWLIYLTLFVAGIAMVVDLVQFVNGFYSGELTFPFFLKLLTVLVVSMLTFGYFLWDLSEKGVQPRQAKILAYTTSAMLLFTLGVGFVLAGSPSHQRAVRLDEQRIMDLQNIEYEIGNYWREKNELPPELSYLERDLYYFLLPVDPETQKNYVYEATGKLSFELCATFSADYQPIPNTQIAKDQWAHGAGYTCYDRTLDPDFFKDNEVTVPNKMDL